MLARSLTLRLFLITVCLLTATTGVQGDDDHEIAQRLVQEGRIRPLMEILEAVRDEVPGEILEIEFETESDTYIYKLKILSSSGKVHEVEVDAETGEIGDIEDED